MCHVCPLKPQVNCESVLSRRILVAKFPSTIVVTSQGWNEHGSDHWTVANVYDRVVTYKHYDNPANRNEPPMALHWLYLSHSSNDWSIARYRKLIYWTKRLFNRLAWEHECMPWIYPSCHGFCHNQAHQCSFSHFSVTIIANPNYMFQTQWLEQPTALCTPIHILSSGIKRSAGREHTLCPDTQPILLFTIQKQPKLKVTIHNIMSTYYNTKNTLSIYREIIWHI